MKRLRIAEGGPTSPVAWEPHDKTRTFPQLNGVEVHVLEQLQKDQVALYEPSAIVLVGTQNLKTW
jgi:hypothetical protein